MKTCTHCHKGFTPLHENHLFCSRRCSVLSKGKSWSEPRVRHSPKRFKFPLPEHVQNLFRPIGLYRP